MVVQASSRENHPRIFKSLCVSLALRRLLFDFLRFSLVFSRFRVCVSLYALGIQSLCFSRLFLSSVRCLYFLGGGAPSATASGSPWHARRASRRARGRRPLPRGVLADEVTNNNVLGLRSGERLPVINMFKYFLYFPNFYQHVQNEKIKYLFCNLRWLGLAFQ